MGTVWLARLSGKLGFERLVALKTILPTYSDDRQFCDMFLDEARIAARIDHENVARILEIGEDRGLIYYAMELIDGESLRKLYRDVRAANVVFPMGVALRIAADACAGLHAVHELRDDDGEPLEVVHRDVSPQNLLVSVRGTTKLIDFGVAKANARRSEETAAGTLKGKIEYMAPEQARGEPLDRRADVYAIGAVLYELLASRPVRDTDEGRQLAALHELMTGVAYPPLPPSIPHVVRGIVDRALARDPQSRFASADELRHALEQAMLATGQGATTDDVAALLAHYSRERTAKRKDAMDRALRAATEGRLNAATIVAPLSAPQVVAPAQPFPPPAMASSQYPVVSGVATTTDGPPTGPSMRTIGPAALEPQPAPRSSAARAVAAVFVLAFVGVLGVIAGVVLTRRAQPVARGAAAGAQVDPATTTATAASATTAAAADTPPPPVVIEPPAPATGLAVRDAAPTASVVNARTGRDAGAKPPRGTKKGGAAPGPKAGDGDEYGF